MIMRKDAFFTANSLIMEARQKLGMLDDDLVLRLEG